MYQTQLRKSGYHHADYDWKLSQLVVITYKRVKYYAHTTGVESWAKPVHCLREKSVVVIIHWNHIRILHRRMFYADECPSASRKCNESEDSSFGL